MKKKTLQETFLREESPYDLGEFGPQPILTDYNSLEELFKAMRKKIAMAMQTGDIEQASEAIRETVREAARYGYVTGHDTAWTEAEEEQKDREWERLA